jgi:RNA polymerase sigma-70 factor (ECF subfamily)
MTNRIPEGRSDDELVQLARGDDAAAREALTELLSRWRGRVYLWCRRFTREHERALDLSQDVLLSVVRSFRQYEGRAPFGAWVFTIARYACIRAMRPVSLVRDDDADIDGVAGEFPDPAVEFEERQDEERVLELMREHLLPEERRALWLRCMERMPVDEITRELRVESVSGARGLLQTARRKLRAALERDRAAGEGGLRT